MYKKIVVAITILLGFIYLSDFGYSRVNFGIVGAIKNKRDKLADNVEKKREEIANKNNNPPNVPSNPTPADGVPGQSLNVDLSWSGGDLDTGDIVTYDIYFGISPNFTLVLNNQTTTTYDPGTLSESNTYYWKVVAKDNHGASTSGPIWTFKIQKIWGTAQLIETDNAGQASSPQVAIDINGNAIAVWRQFDGTRYNIYSNRYVSGISWGTAQLIETDNAGDAYDPQVAMDVNGNAIAVWQQRDVATNNIWSNRYVYGTGWGTAQIIKADTGGVISPQLVIDSSGNAIAVWSQFNIWSNRYVSGTGWGTAQLIESDTGQASSSQVAIDTNGNAIAVWQQHDGATNNIWSNRYVSGTGWGTAQLVETNNAGAACDPQVAIDTNGNAIAVWQQHDGATNNIWSNRYVSGTGWGTAQLIETDNNSPASSPRLAIDTNGNAIAVWRQFDSIKYEIYSNRYVSGIGWGIAQLIEADGGVGHQLAIDTSGNAIAIWQKHDDATDNIYSNRYVSGTGWGTAQLIESDNGPANSPQVAMDRNGNAIAVWCQYDFTTYNIWSGRYEQ